MDEEGILKVLEELKIDDLILYDKNVQFPCILADYSDGHSNYSDHSGSMGVSISPGDVSKVHCFSCDFSGTLSYLVRTYQRYTKTDFTGLLRLIEDLEDRTPEQIANSITDYEVEINRYEEMVIGECFLRMVFVPGAHKSIINRGLTVDTLKVWDTRLDERFNRVVFPVRSRKVAGGCPSRKNLIGAVGRTYVDHAVKYYNYCRFDKSHYLYGEHLIKEQTAAVLVEGMVDTVLLWQELEAVRKEYAVLGSMGSSVSKAQKRKLSRWFDEVILFLDNDPSGWTGQLNLAKDLGRKIIIKAVRYPGVGGKDPAELIKNGVDVVELIRRADLLVV